MNLKQRRAAARPLAREEFERELRAVVDGDPSADPTNRWFWSELASAGDVVAAINTDDGVEVLRGPKGGQR